VERPSTRRSAPHNVAIVLAFTLSATAAACTASPDDDWGDGAAGSGALAGNGAGAGSNATGGSSAGTNATGGSSAGTNATGGSSAGTNATGGSSAGTNAVGGFSGSGQNATGGTAGVGGTAAGSGGTSGFGGNATAGVGGVQGKGGSAGAFGSGGTGGAGGAGGEEVPDEPYCAVTANWDPEHAALEEEIVVLVNQYRAEGANCGGEEMPPVGPLTMDPNLRCAARVHTKDMADRDFFDHDNPDGDGPSERMEAAGYDGRTWGENIAGGRATAEETMEQWMNSPGHCVNIMGEDYTLIGVGYYPGGEYRHLWTQTFGG
jgi:uncharacterized protein YkwD